MKIIPPGIEIIDAPDYEAMKKKLEQIGRVCYKSEGNIQPGSADYFLQRIIKSGHESVIEHASISVHVICDRGVTHEIVRHRIASYSQESTRYCNYANEKFGGEITFIDIKDAFGYDLDQPTDREKYELWQKSLRCAEQNYLDLISLGAKPEEARGVLPNSLKTEIIMTMNLREWRHFFLLRCAKRAHPQMREVADLILTEFIQRYPLFFNDLSLD